MRHMHNGGWKEILLAGLLVVLTGGMVIGCQTTPPEPDFTPAVEQPVEFTPAHYVTPLTFESGRYDDLFTRDSYAVWVGPEVAQAKYQYAVDANEYIEPGLEDEAARIVNNYVVIECHLESAFSDTSIAYDAVMLRGIDVSLEMPDGRRIAPIQRVIGRVDEEQRGALRAFRRTNLFVFPRRDLWFGRLTLDPSYPSVKLVIERHDSRYAFEWPDASYADPTHVPVTPETRMQQIRVSFNELFQSVRRVSHIFD